RIRQALRIFAASRAERFRGLEIVQHAKLRKSEALGEFAAPQAPARPIGERDLLAVARAGNAERPRARGGPGPVARAAARPGAVRDVASANRLLLPPISARRVVRIAATPE